MTLTADEKGRLTCRGLFPPRAAFDAQKDELGRVVLNRLASKLSVRDLTSDETLAAIRLADQRGVQGARIHDLLHVRAATLAGARLVLTRDRGFSASAENIRAEWP
jgi:hypothetical protein